MIVDTALSDPGMSRDGLCRCTAHTGLAHAGQRSIEDSFAHEGQSIHVFMVPE